MQRSQKSEYNVSENALKNYFLCTYEFSGLLNRYNFIIVDYW